MGARGRDFMIGALLTVPSFNLNARVHARLHERGFREITDSNSTVMKVLGPDGDRITELARKAAMTKQSMGYLVDQLEAAGYVERVNDPSDARAFIIRRTKVGWAYNRAAAEEVAQLQEEWAQLLGPAKMKQLKALLTELVAKLGYQYEGSSADVATRSPRLHAGSRKSA
jgi:DNA-binding MarR family transcriptional regulator